MTRKKYIKEIPIFKEVGYRFTSITEANNIVTKNNDTFVKGVYSRHENQTIYEVEKQLSIMFGTVWSVLTPSGMSAIDIALSVYQTSSDNKPWAFLNQIYSGTRSYVNRVLTRRGIRIVWIDPELSGDFDLIKVEEVINVQRPKVLFLESISNPYLITADIPQLTNICNKYGVKVVVDNTIATSMLLNPLDFGVDMVVYSATKYISGHNSLMAGIISGNDKNIETEVRQYRKNTGQVISPENAFSLNEKSKTFPLRFMKQCQNAHLLVKDIFMKSEKINNVRYPGLEWNAENEPYGAVIMFEFKGSTPESQFKACEDFVIAVSNELHYSLSLGSVNTTLVHIKSFFNVETLTVTPGMMRLSVGIEDYSNLKDIIVDGLKKVKIR
ncbi:aminotransferase class V-fold PLP-dependent enzyme [Evansella sp. AB-P1]|uniref:aminotransferase class V-fold PLP-dependent enzyme n=1 Tax=Evansella sp. AB-P1 TaxID=3037653 RepID=UPI00241D021C|nr:aminotransferase class V-fold PLP-dependent enzyme [Evansella sp. AB-P1]MDG5788615.1 aminotransferase class V-fold PLP-dependent enzyme [Evansella sp. AB-P1]